ncbi:MAG: hypothetical protein WCJ35_05840 [Planctomycetota bacterium]
MKQFPRLSLGFGKKLENLDAAVAIFLTYYFAGRPVCPARAIKPSFRPRWRPESPKP